MIVNLSVLIVVSNEEKQLKDCIETVKFADEIVIVLDKCTDKSKKLQKITQIKFMKVHGILREKEEIMALKSVMVSGSLRLMQMKEFLII